MRIHKIRIGMWLCIMLFCLLWEGNSAKANEPDKVIRVGYPIQEGFTMLDEAGRRSGYTYDYLMEISKYTGWEYEFVELEGSLDEQLITMLDMLEKGELDLLGCMEYNEALTELYDYPGGNYGNAYYALCALEGNSEITSTNYYLMPKLRVGVFSSKNKINEKLQQFAETSGIEAEQIFADSDEEMWQLLEQGEVDAILTKDISIPFTRVTILTRFSPQPYYFATTKGNKEIVNLLDEAQNAITTNNPYFAINLWDTYFNSHNQETEYTENEKTYMENAPVLKVAVFGGRPPIQYVGEDGSYGGVSVDVLEFIAEETGLRFELLMTEDYDEYARLIESREADLALGVSDILQQYSWQDYITTVPYMEVPLSIVLTQDTDVNGIKGKHLAISKGTSYEGEYEGKVTYYESAWECLEAVSEGKADYTYSGSYVVQYYQSALERQNLITLPMDEEWTRRYCIGVIDREDQMLVGILNKAIGNFSVKNLLQGYLYKNAYRQKEISFAAYLRANTFEVIIVSILFVSLLLLTILFLIRRRDKKNEIVRRVENERYEQIGEISNEYLFEYDVEKDRLKLTDKCAQYLNMPGITENAKEQYGHEEYIEQILKLEDKNVEIQMDIDGRKKRWVRVTTKWIKDSKGKSVYLVGKLTDIQEEREAWERLRNKAEYDSLTGVYNMATFREQVHKMHERHKQQRFALYIIDIDRFKEVNDTFGHYTGDYVLEQMGRALREIFPAEESVSGRLGGDEFAVLTLYHEDMERIEENCRRLQEKVGEIDFEMKKEPVTISMGATIMENQEDFEVSYKRADEALYEQKKRGRNGYYILPNFSAEKGEPGANM